MNVTIIGAGSWGSSLGRILGDNGVEVKMFDLDENTIEEINEYHSTPKLPNSKLPLNISGTTSLSEAIDFANVVVLCVPTKVMRSVLKNINSIIDSPKLFVNASKGVEPDTFKRVSEIVDEEIDREFVRGYVAIYGPTHAEEVIDQKLTLACSVSNNDEHAKLVQRLFNNNKYFRVYTNNDLIGAELCGAMKNVYAIAGGVLEGLGFGDNAKAGLIARALVEIKKIVVAMNGKESTVMGLTGIGDLIATATSRHSRNYQAGLLLAQGENVDDIEKSMSMVVEGIRSARSIYGLCKKLNLDCPIIEAIYNVVYNNHNPREVVGSLMSREVKEETL